MVTVDFGHGEATLHQGEWTGGDESPVMACVRAWTTLQIMIPGLSYSPGWLSRDDQLARQAAQHFHGTIVRADPLTPRPALPPGTYY
jgi:hypothetical protein